MTTETSDPTATLGTLQSAVKQVRETILKELLDAAPRFGVTLKKDTIGPLVITDVGMLAVRAISSYDTTKLDEGSNAMFIFFNVDQDRNASNLPSGFYVLRAFSGRGEREPYGLLLDERGAVVAEVKAKLEKKQTPVAFGLSLDVFPSSSNSVSFCGDIELNGEVYTACITVQ